MVTDTLSTKETESIPSVKDLASSEPSIRRKSIQQILSHLETRSSLNNLTHTQALQLWRGFHIALYMHDSKNQLSVQKLIAMLASTYKIIRSKDQQLAPESISPDSAASEIFPLATRSNKRTTTQDNDEAEDDFAGFDDEEEPVSAPEIDSTWMAVYSTAFWETIAREWSGVDQWRMNKYLLLTRFVLREIFSICLSSYFGVEPNYQSQLQDNVAGEEQEQATTTTTTKTKTKKRKTINNDDSNTMTQPKKSKKSNPTSSSTTTTTAQSSPLPTQDSTTLKSQLLILSTHPLSPRSRQTTSDGLRLHLLDIYLDELVHAAKTLKSQHESITTSALQDILKTEFKAPIQGVATEGLARHVRTRAKEVLSEFDGRVEEVV